MEWNCWGFDIRFSGYVICSVNSVEVCIFGLAHKQFNEWLCYQLKFQFQYYGRVVYILFYGMCRAVL